MNRSQFVEIIAETICDEHGYRDAYGCANCAVERLEKAGLLNFDKPTGAITESAHSANTNVGRSADSDTTQSIGDGGADSSETAVVGQNEQGKEVCPANSLFIHPKGELFFCGSCGFIVGQTDSLRPQEP